MSFRIKRFKHASETLFQHAFSSTHFQLLTFWPPPNRHFPTPYTYQNHSSLSTLDVSHREYTQLRQHNNLKHKIPNMARQTGN